MKVVSPATGEVIVDLPSDTTASVAQKFIRAKEAQPLWWKTPLTERKNRIKKFGDLIQSRKEELSRILTQEMGKPISQSRNEISAVTERIDFMLENCDHVMRREHVLDGSTCEEIQKEALGVIANISAWNYPYFIGVNVFVPALLTGNCVLYKPSEYTSLTGLEIAKMMKEVGIAEGVFTAVIGDGTIGDAILTQPIDGLFFTGSIGTGKTIVEKLAKRLIQLQLELGGKDPVYVCEDADIKNSAASLAEGAMYNSGQSCCSVERIYVQEKILGPFLVAFLESVGGFRLGDPMHERTTMGPLAREGQISFLEEQVHDALAKGAKLLCGGRRVERRYFEPTVLTDVNHSMRVMTEESFGPIIGIQKVRGDEEAIGLMNDSSYGLTAGVYTGDEKRARAILSQVAAGSVYWNCCDRVSPRLPWSARKESGVGCTSSCYGIQSFLRLKSWHLRKAVTKY